MSLDRLSGFDLFATVIEAGSFTAAAAQLGISKSAVSKALTRLEDRLGARLIARTTRRLALTEAGEYFLAHSRRILEEAAAAEQAVRRLQAAPRGTLRVNAPVTFGVMHIAPLLPEFMARYPGIAVEIAFNDRRVDLVEEGYDLAVRIGLLADSSLIARKLCDERHVVVAAPAYWDRAGRPARPADLARHDCLTYAYLSTGDQWRFARDGRPENVRVRGRLRSNNGEALKFAALAGQGVALMPRFACWRDIAAGRLEIGLPGWEPPPLGLYALWPETRQVPAKVRAFVDFLAENLDPAPPWDAAPAAAP